MAWLCFGELREMLLMVSWAHQSSRGKVWGHGVDSQNMAGDCPLKHQWVRVRTADWGAESPIWCDFHTFLGMQNLTESWTQQEFLDGSVESLWFTLLMETFNSVAHVNLNLQTQVYRNSFSLFFINYLNMDLESLSHQGGGQEVWPQSFWVSSLTGFMPGVLVLRPFHPLMMLSPLSS